MSGTFDLRATSGAVSTVLGRYTTQASAPPPPVTHVGPAELPRITPVTLTGAGIIIQIEGLTFRGCISGASLTPATPPPTPAFDTIRYEDNDPAPWAPAAGPTVGVPYTFTLEAWDSALGVRDTGATGDVTLNVDFVLGGGVVIASGPTTVA